MQAGTTVGRPPLPDHKKRNVRRVMMLNQAEADRFDRLCAEIDEGPNELLRRLVFQEMERVSND